MVYLVRTSEFMGDWEKAWSILGDMIKYVGQNYDQDSLEENLRRRLESRRSQTPLVRLERSPQGYRDGIAVESPRNSSVLRRR